MDRQDPVIAKGEKSSSHPLARRRPTKFTPGGGRADQESRRKWKSREEIAELIGVTVGSLQVTCSSLGGEVVDVVTVRLLRRLSKPTLQCPTRGVGVLTRAWRTSP
jgi:hypothetical protein